LKTSKKGNFCNVASFDVKYRPTGPDGSRSNKEVVYRTNLSKREAKSLVKELKKKNVVAFFVTAINPGPTVAYDEPELPDYESEVA
jgi:hypothetical protein